MASPDAKKIANLTLDEINGRLDRCGGKHRDHLMTELQKRANDQSQTSKTGKALLKEAERILKAYTE